LVSIAIRGYIDVEGKRKLRVMVAKPGLDGHDRGARIIARAFRDAGFEVIYSGLHQTPEEIVQTAIQEDVDMIGLSSLAGAHMVLFKKVVERLEETGSKDIVVCGGGIIPAEDILKLKQAGIKEIFTPGDRLDDIIAWVESNVSPRGI
jgi:methylmalonyl-CoA mutase, C-terminal domain